MIDDGSVSATQGALTPMGWGSDAVVALLHELELPYAAVVPGSSFRGLHDSLVNYLGDDADPRMLVCLHEEHTVAIAHGYAKVTNKPMLAVIHANVGLMHATMAFYDAWNDRVPVLVLGANGPHDATLRRPWIDWIHSARDQAALVRHYTKWDDEPGSVRSTLESILRAYQIATTPPYGPTYVVLDVALQEEKLDAPLALPPVERFAAPDPWVPAHESVAKAAAILRAAKRPLILVGRSTRDLGAWNDRVALAEKLGARVVAELNVGAVFPTDHPLHVGRPSTRLGKEQIAAVREADVILNLDRIDFGGALQQAFGTETPPPTLISCSVDRFVHNGWSNDHQSLPPVDLNIAAPHERFVPLLLAELGEHRPAAQWPAPSSNGASANGASAPATGEMGMISFSAGLNDAFAGENVCYIRLPLGTGGGARFTFRHPLDFLGGDGGGGVGAGPGLAVGAALALRGTDRLPVAVLGDGDYLMGLTALWTAVANQIPLLVVIANNRCYHNDVVHQERMALQRNRPVERKWIGQTISDPPPDLAMLARGQGAVGIGPIERREDLADALRRAIDEVKAGKVCVVDVLVAPELDERPPLVAARAGATA